MLSVSNDLQNSRNTKKKRKEITNYIQDIDMSSFRGQNSKKLKELLQKHRS